MSDTLAGVTLPHVDQVNESDMNLLTRLAKDHDAIAKPAGGKLDLLLPGSTDLAAEVRVILSGFREGVDGTWVASRVQHVVDSGGYRCSVEAEVPAPV